MQTYVSRFRHRRRPRPRRKRRRVPNSLAQWLDVRDLDPANMGTLQVRWMARIPRPDEGFCSVCTTTDHPEGEACIYLVYEDEGTYPILEDYRLDSLTLQVVGSGEWLAAYTVPSGRQPGVVLSATDGLIQIPTGGSGPKKISDFSDAEIVRLGGPSTYGLSSVGFKSINNLNIRRG